MLKLVCRLMLSNNEGECFTKSVISSGGVITKVKCHLVNWVFYI